MTAKFATYLKFRIINMSDLAIILLSLFHSYSGHFSVSHHVHGLVAQTPLSACLQCQVRAYSTEI